MLTHFLTSQPALIKLDNENIGGHLTPLQPTSIFFCNRICDTWTNALPHTVVEAPSLNTFKKLLNNVAVCHVAVLS